MNVHQFDILSDTIESLFPRPESMDWAAYMEFIAEATRAAARVIDVAGLSGGAMARRTGDRRCACGRVSADDECDDECEAR